MEGCFASSPGNGNPLLLAPGEFMGKPLFLTFQAQGFERFQGCLLLFFAGKLKGEKNIFQRGEGGKEVEKLEDEPDADAAQHGSAVLAERCKVFTGDFYQPLRGMVKAGDQVEERGFAGPAFAVNCYQLSGRDVKTCPAQSSSAAPISTHNISKHQQYELLAA